MQTEQEAAPVSYLAPTDLNEALDHLAKTGARIIAGGTDYYPARQPSQHAEPLLDITRLTGLRGITHSAQGWRIGAATTWTDILRADLPPAFDGLKQAAAEVGSVQIQNRGTVAGNLCNASPAADGVPPLLTLDAEVELAAPGSTRRLPLAAFLTGPRQTARAPGEVLCAVHIPNPGAARSAFVKLGSRTHLVISIAMASALIHSTDGRISQARLAVGSCSATAQRLPAVEAALRGLTAADLAAGPSLPADALAALSPITDARASAAYRRDAALTLCLRAAARALTEARP